MLDLAHSYLFVLVMESLFIYLSMWRILLSLVTIYLLLQFLLNSHPQGFPLKILGTLFLGCQNLDATHLKQVHLGCSLSYQDVQC